MSATMLTYIMQQTTELPRIIREHGDTLNSLKQFCQGRTIKRILIIATGSSYNAALCTRYYFMQQCRIHVDIKEPYNYTHYEPTDHSIDLAIAISQSGKSASTIAAQRKIQTAKIPVFSLTSDPQSPITESSDGVLNINTGIETVGFVTLGFSATIVNLLLISSIIALQQGNIRQQQYTCLTDTLTQICGKIPNIIDKTENFIAQHCRTFTDASRFIAIGYGALEGVTKEFATKFTETVRLPATGFELEAYMHGPYLEANANHLLFFIEDKVNNRMHALRDYMAPYVNAVFTLNATDNISTENTLTCGLSVEHDFSPLLLIIPVQLMAYRIAALKNIDLSIRIFDDFDNVLRSKI